MCLESALGFKPGSVTPFVPRLFSDVADAHRQSHLELFQVAAREAGAEQLRLRDL